MAPPAPKRNLRHMARKTNTTASSNASSSSCSSPEDANQAPDLPPGKDPLPETAGEFVEEIHRNVDLAEVWRGLLRSKDEKVRQRAAERLTDLRYKLEAAAEHEPQHILFDVPRPDPD